MFNTLPKHEGPIVDSGLVRGARKVLLTLLLVSLLFVWPLRSNSACAQAVPKKDKPNPSCLSVDVVWHRKSDWSLIVPAKIRRD